MRPKEPYGSLRLVLAPGAAVAAFLDAVEDAALAFDIIDIMPSGRNWKELPPAAVAVLFFAIVGRCTSWRDVTPPNPFPTFPVATALRFKPAAMLAVCAVCGACENVPT